MAELVVLPLVCCAGFLFMLAVAYWLVVLGRQQELERSARRRREAAPER